MISIITLSVTTCNYCSSCGARSIFFNSMIICVNDVNIFIFINENIIWIMWQCLNNCCIGSTFFKFIKLIWVWVLIPTNRIYRAVNINFQVMTSTTFCSSNISISKLVSICIILIFINHSNLIRLIFNRIIQLKFCCSRGLIFNKYVFRMFLVNICCDYYTFMFSN